MKHRIGLELLIILGLAAVIGIYSRNPTKNRTEEPPTKSPTTSNVTVPPIAGNLTLAVLPPAVLRWSSGGGCFADSDFYFELRTNESGAQWIALLTAYGTWHENLIADAPQSNRIPGNYLSSGRLNTLETNEFIKDLMKTDPLDVQSQQCHTGATLSLYVKLGNQENKVPYFQASSGATDSPEHRFNSFAYSHDVFNQEWEALRLRFARGEKPDFPLSAPGPHWLTNEHESLFARYPRHLSNAPSTEEAILPAPPSDRA